MGNKLRVALVYKDLGLGGVQRKIVDITHALVAQKKAQVYLFLSEAKGEFLKKIPSQVRLVDLNVSLYPPHVFILPVKLVIAFLKYKPEIVLAMMDTFGCSAVLARKMMLGSKPTIVISQEIQASGFFRQRPWPWLRKTLVNQLYPQADRVLSVSTAVTQDLVQNFHILGRKIVLIRNWTETPKHQVPYSRKTIDVIYAGRFAAEKNLSLLLEAFGLLSKKRPDSKLCLLGYGEEEQLLRTKIKRLSLDAKVSLPGFTYETDRYLRKAKVLVMTSSNEGIPLAILEAMANRVSVISTSFPGIQELITHGQTGFIADSAKEIAYWMLHLLRDKRLAREITDNAVAMLNKRYPPENIQKLINILTKT